jgi:hypothetical protein
MVRGRTANSGVTSTTASVFADDGRGVNAISDCDNHGSATEVNETELQAHFDGVIAADGRVEPRDWMPDGYR